MIELTPEVVERMRKEKTMDLEQKLNLAQAAYDNERKMCDAANLRIIERNGEINVLRAQVAHKDRLLAGYKHLLREYESESDKE